MDFFGNSLEEQLNAQSAPPSVRASHRAMTWSHPAPSQTPGTPSESGPVSRHSLPAPIPANRDSERSTPPSHQGPGHRASLSRAVLGNRSPAVCESIEEEASENVGRTSFTATGADVLPRRASREIAPFGPIQRPVRRAADSESNFHGAQLHFIVPTAMALPSFAQASAQYGIESHDFAHDMPPESDDESVGESVGGINL